jgi:hypothetical protein
LYSALVANGKDSAFISISCDGVGGVIFNALVCHLLACLSPKAASHFMPHKVKTFASCVFDSNETQFSDGCLFSCRSNMSF